MVRLLLLPLQLPLNWRTMPLKLSAVFPKKALYLIWSSMDKDFWD